MSTGQPSAARRVYEVPDLLQNILSLLAPHDLATFMRVEEDLVPDVAAELYGEVTYNTVRLKMSSATVRQRLYCSAVRHINAKEMTLSPTMLRQLEIENLMGSGAEKTRRIAKWLRTYRPNLINLIVPQLRAKCGSLQTIRFGVPYTPYGSAGWVVYFNPSRNHTTEPSPSTAGRRWLLEHLHTLNIKEAMPPVKTITVPPAPSPQYTVHARFDLRFTKVEPSLFEEWLACIDESDDYRNVYKHADFGNLPITLGTITKLYTKQIAALHAERLAVIKALSTSTSLTSLKLADGYRKAVAKVASVDLPEFVSTIKDNLPHLVELSFAMDGIANAEDVVCRQHLTPMSLADGGSLTTLHLYTAHHSSPLFNLIRSLSQICQRQCFVDVGRYSVHNDDRCLSYMPGNRHVSAEDGDKLQMKYLDYLRSQPPRRQQHLGTVDLPRLGIKTYSHVSSLVYHDDGRPVSRLESQAAAWADKTREKAAGWTKRTLIHDLDLEMSELAEATEKFKEIVSTASEDEVVEEMRKLLALSDRVDKASKRARKSLETQSTGKEIRELIASLEGKAAGGGKGKTSGTMRWLGGRGRDPLSLLSDSEDHSWDLKRW